MRTVLFGGSFDPPHIGHLFLAEELLKQLDYERIILVPAAEAPHKEPSGATTSAQRIEMLRSAVAEIDSLVVDDCEIRRGGTSYTVETIPVLLSQYDITGRLALVIGDDLIEGFQTWKDHELLVEMVDIVIAHRTFREKVAFSYQHVYLDNLLLPVSSSEIRARVREGKAYRHIVPESVFRYIEENMLYIQRDSD